jgi:hypothetical protein
MTLKKRELLEQKAKPVAKEQLVNNVVFAGFVRAWEKFSLRFLGSSSL